MTMPTALSVVDGWQPALTSRPLRLSGAGRLTFAGLAAAGVAAVAITVAITLSGSSSGAQAAARAAMVGTPIAVGLYAMRHAASARFGLQLVIAGFRWFLASLSG